MHLESRISHLAPGTVDLRLGAVRRLAYEAADCGLLSADLAAGIRRATRLVLLFLRFWFCFITRGLYRHGLIMHLPTPSSVRFAGDPTGALDPNQKYDWGLLVHPGSMTKQFTSHDLPGMRFSGVG